MNEIVISLNEHSPKYLQIYHTLRSFIEDGALQAGSKLPSIRQLAEMLHVSRNTTLSAYEQLLAEGYIRSEPKKGYYVEHVESVHLGIADPIEMAQLEEHAEISIDFRIGGVDREAFPLKTWRKLSNEVLLEEQTYRYGERQGELCLRKRITSYLLHSRGIRTRAEFIVIGSSTQQLLLHLSILLRQEYAEIALENPGYDGARSIFMMQGYGIHPIDVTSKGINLDQLINSQARLIYTTPSHQFPTGVTMTIPVRQALLAWASEREAYIIEDDYDSEFRYKQQPIPALSSLEQEGRVIYISTFSKAFLPGIRLSYMVLPPLLLEQYKQTFSTVEQSASLLHQRAMTRFMESGHWDSHIRRMRSTYKRKIQTLITSLHLHFGSSIRLLGADSGLYVLVECPKQVSETMLIRKAQASGVKVYPTSGYFLDTKVRPTRIQLGFSNLTIEQIQQGVERLAQAWGSCFEKLT